MTGGRGRWVLAVALPVVLVTVVSGCRAPGDEPDGHAPGPASEVITVGSFDFQESELLAHLYGQALESRGYPVRLELGIGPRELVQPALAGGLVDLVPDYAGTALDFLSLGATAPSPGIERTRRDLTRTLRRTDVMASTPAPAEDANAVVVTRRTAARYDLQDISDLAAVAPELTFGGPPECPTRPLCLAGLEQAYGLAFDEFLALDAGGPLTRQALDDGYVDVALLFTTDPALGDGDLSGDPGEGGDGDGLVVLRDDRHLQPAENVTPLVRTEVVDRHGDGLVRTLDAVSRRLTTGELRDMNAQVVEDRRPPSAVAADWLSAQGLS